MRCGDFVVASAAFPRSFGGSLRGGVSLRPDGPTRGPRRRLVGPVGDPVRVTDGEIRGRAFGGTDLRWDDDGEGLYVLRVPDDRVPFARAERYRRTLRAAGREDFEFAVRADQWHVTRDADDRARAWRLVPDFLDPRLLSTAWL